MKSLIKFLSISILAIGLVFSSCNNEELESEVVPSPSIAAPGETVTLDATSSTAPEGTNCTWILPAGIHSEQLTYTDLR